MASRRVDLDPHQDFGDRSGRVGYAASGGIGNGNPNSAGGKVAAVSGTSGWRGRVRAQCL